MQRVRLLDLTRASYLDPQAVTGKPATARRLAAAPHAQRYGYASDSDAALALALEAFLAASLRVNGRLVIAGQHAPAIRSPARYALEAGDLAWAERELRDALPAGEDFAAPNLYDLAPILFDAAGRETLLDDDDPLVGVAVRNLVSGQVMRDDPEHDLPYASLLVPLLTNGGSRYAGDLQSAPPSGAAGLGLGSWSRDPLTLHGETATAGRDVTGDAARLYLADPALAAAHAARRLD